MAIDYQVDSLEGIDEALHGLYQESDGKFVLDVTGVKPIQEFDVVNSTMVKERNLKKELEKKLKAFGDRTPENFAELEQKVSELQVLADSNTSNTDDVKERIENIKKDYEAKLNFTKESSLKESLEKDNIIQELKNTILEGKKQESIFKEAQKYCKTEALEDVMALLKQKICYNSDLEQFEEKETGLDVKATVEKFFKEKPLYVKESTSGNATGNTGNSNGLNNPFSEKSWNRTEQARMFKENPEQARKLQKQALKK